MSMLKTYWTHYDIGDLCTHCGRDTSAGNGFFVDRIPSYADSDQAQEWFEDWQNYDVLDGYMCRECYMNNFGDWEENVSE